MSGERRQETGGAAWLSETGLGDSETLSQTVKVDRDQGKAPDIKPQASTHKGARTRMHTHTHTRQEMPPLAQLICQLKFQNPKKSNLKLTVKIQVGEVFPSTRKQTLAGRTATFSPGTVLMRN